VVPGGWALRENQADSGPTLTSMEVISVRLELSEVLSPAKGTRLSACHDKAFNNFDFSIA
jgi:hypothetical protein